MIWLAGICKGLVEKGYLHVENISEIVGFELRMAGWT
jgi:hypothetical protein